MAQKYAAADKSMHYDAIYRCIQQEGKQNPNYASDYDLTYGMLKDKLGAKVPGLAALLKTMKRDKKVDYDDEGGFLKDSHVITAIGDENAEKTTEFIR